MRRLPLFPLPVVLFPGAPLPLHIFEARYRQMTAHCLEGDRRFGLVYHDPDRSGPFRTDQERVGCVAEIVQFQPLPDGRSLMVVQGLERFRLVDGIESDSLYYEGLVEAYADDPGTEIAEQRSRDTLERFGRVLERLGEPGAPAPPVDAGRPLSFQLARWIQIEAARQQALLELRSEGERLERIDALLRTILEE